MGEIESKKAPNVPKRPQEAQFDGGDNAMPSLNAPIDRGPEVVAQSLAPQLGSTPQHLAQGDFDMRKLSVISERDIPMLIYAKIRARKNKTWQIIYEEFLNLPVSVNGRGRRDIIRMEGVSKAGLPDMNNEDTKPGWLERNVTNRGEWKKRQQEDMM